MFVLASESIYFSLLQDLKILLVLFILVTTFSAVIGDDDEELW